MAKKFNIPESYDPINEENNALKQQNRKISKLLPSQSISNCEVASDAEVTCEYPRSKIKKIIEDFKKLHKTNCDPSTYDPCTLDDTGLVIPDADIIVDVIRDKTITVSNKSYIATCTNAYSASAYPEMSGYYTRLDDTNTVDSGIFNRKLVFPGDTPQTVINEKVKQVQDELDAIAKAFGDSRLNCGYTNAAKILTCKDNDIDGEAKLIADMSNSASIVAEEITVYFSDNENYNKNLGNILLSQIFTLLISKLNCYYGNSEMSLTCLEETELPDPNDASSLNYQLVDSSVISSVTTINGNSIIESIDLNSSDFFIDGEWNLNSYKTWNDIDTRLSSLTEAKTYEVSHSAQDLMFATATCNYTNNQVTLSCPKGDTQNWQPAIDPDLDPKTKLEVGSHIITVEASSEYLGKAYNTGPYSARLQLTSSGRTYVHDDIAAYISDATESYQGYSCILYNNQVAAYCDALTGTEEKSSGEVSGQTEPRRYDAYLAGTANGIPIKYRFINGVIIFKNDWEDVTYTKEIITNPDRYNISHCGECGNSEASDKCNNCTVYRDLSVYRYIVPAKTYITYYVDAGSRLVSEIQTELNTQAATQAISSLNCLYGNKHLDSIPCTKLAKNCGASGVNNEISSPAAEVTENTYFANSPEDADVQAATAAIASAFCICYDWMGGGGGSSISIKQEGSCGDCNQQYCVFSE